MRVSILTIGNELLSGKTINTNASWISKKLSLNGVSVTSHLLFQMTKIELLIL